MKGRNFLIFLLAAVALALTLTGCPSPEEPHIHTYSNEWSCDMTHHWREATCGHELIIEEGIHTYGDWIVVRQPTENESGEKYHECSTCHHKEGAVISSLGDDPGVPHGEDPADPPGWDPADPQGGDPSDPQGGDNPPPQTPQFTITYQSAYAAAPSAKTVDEGYTLTAADLPELTQQGYVFGGWNKAVGFAVSGNVEVTASWTPATDTPYTVEHYQQNLADADYALTDTDNKTGTTGTLTQAAAKTYDGFTPVAGYENAAIAADGSTVVKIYYDRLGSVQMNLTFTAHDITVTPVESDDTITLTPAAGYSDYTWTLNGHALDESCSVDDDGVLTFEKILADNGDGTYVFTLKAKKNGITYTTSALFNIDDIESNTVTGNWPGSTTVQYKKRNSKMVISGTGELPDRGLYSSLDISGYEDITEVIIEEGITKIGMYVFKNFDKLITVKGCENITEIGNSAFYNCTSLTSVEGFNAVTYIWHNAFEGCSALTSIKGFNSVLGVWDEAFKGCTALTTIEGFNSVPSLDISFEDFTSLTTVEGFNSATNIANDTFKGCSALVRLKGFSELTIIYQNAFNGCTSFVGIEFGGTEEQLNSEDFFIYETGNEALYDQDGNLKITVISNN